MRRKIYNRRTKNASQLKPVALTQEFDRECHSVTERKYNTMASIYTDLRDRPQILKEIDSLNAYINTENTTVGKGQLFENLILLCAREAYGPKDTVTVTKGSHDHGIDHVLNIDGKLRFLQAKFRTSGSITRSDVGGIVMARYRAYNECCGEQMSPEQVAKRLMNPNCPEKFVLVTQAKVSNEAKELFRRYNFVVVDKEIIIDFLNNPKRFLV